MSEFQLSTRIITWPNMLTFMRMGLIPVFAITLAYQHEVWALIIFSIAGISDGVDGFVARMIKQESELGVVIDPLADKLLMTTTFVMLTVPGVLAPGHHLPVPFWVTATVIGRDILIVAVAGAINMMTGFHSFRPSFLGKVSTLVQILAVVLILIAAIYPEINGFYLPAVYTTVSAFAILSGVHYIFHVSKLMRAESATNLSC